MEQYGWIVWIAVMIVFGILETATVNMTSIWFVGGALAGLVFHLSPFWIYTFLKIDQIIKCIWCYFRLRSGKWLKKIKPAEQSA